jgi:hypothetical protein
MLLAVSAYDEDVNGFDDVPAAVSLLHVAVRLRSSPDMGRVCSMYQNVAANASSMDEESSSNANVCFVSSARALLFFVGLL